MKIKRLALPVFCLGLLIQAPNVILAQTQAKRPAIEAFGSDSPERGTTRVGYWNNEKQAGAGQFAIDFGRPVWKQQYEDSGIFDKMTKGKVWRLGSNWWTVLETDTPLTVAGQQVPAGEWFLGLLRSADGANWSLVFINPAKVRPMRLDASQIGLAPIEFKAPMTASKPDSSKEKLEIALDFKEPQIQDVTLRIAWGNLQLTAPVKTTINK